MFSIFNHVIKSVPDTNCESALPVLLQMAKFNTKSISNREAFCKFSLMPNKKCVKRPRNICKYIIPFQKRNFLGHRVQNVPENSAKTSLPWLHFKTAMGSTEKKTRLNSSKDDFLMKSKSLPPFSTKRKLSILLNFLFQFFYLNGVVFTLKCRTLILKPLDGNRAAAILLKMLGFQIW